MDKKRIIKFVLAGCFVILCGGLYLVYGSPFGTSSEVVLEKQAEEGERVTGIFEDDGETVQGEGEEDPTESAEKAPTLYVHVCGAVLEEGVYELPEGSRVTDGIKAAGGFRKDADMTFHNLALLLSDGQKIYVPTLEETKALSLPERTEDGLSGTTGADGGSEGKKVNLNTAGLTELMTLNGIGQAKAESILKYREKVGRFQRIEELKNVSGIGDAMFERIKDDIVTE